MGQGSGTSLDQMMMARSMGARPAYAIPPPLPPPAPGPGRDPGLPPGDPPPGSGGGGPTGEDPGAGGPGSAGGVRRPWDRGNLMLQPASWIPSEATPYLKDLGFKKQTGNRLIRAARKGHIVFDREGRDPRYFPPEPGVIDAWGSGWENVFKLSDFGTAANASSAERALQDISTRWMTQREEKRSKKRKA